MDITQLRLKNPKGFTLLASLKEAAKKIDEGNPRWSIDKIIYTELRDFPELSISDIFAHIVAMPELWPILKSESKKYREHWSAAISEITELEADSLHQPELSIQQRSAQSIVNPIERLLAEIAVQLSRIADQLENSSVRF